VRRFVYVLAGLVAGYAAVAVAGILLAEVARISQAEGAYMMGVFFVWAPLGAVVGGLAGVLLAR
jgi:hypothetical protein